MIPAQFERVLMSILKFYHSGDLGDIIFSLPLIRWKGRGSLILDASDCKFDPVVNWASGLLSNTKLNYESCLSISGLLRIQDYIEDVQIVEGPVDFCDINLNLFREHIHFNNLAYSHLAILEDDSQRYFDLTKKPWIQVEPMPLPPGKDVVIARNLRYQSNHYFWECLPRDVSGRAVFIGSELEYKVFTYLFPYHEVVYLETKSILNLARLIAGAKQFIGNQGLPHALAEAMNIQLTCEADKNYPAAVFPDKPSSTYV